MPSVLEEKMKLCVGCGSFSYAEVPVDHHIFVRIEITQRRRGYFDPDVQRAVDADASAAEPPKPDFVFRAGCTVLVDPRNADVRRVIRTAGTIAETRELDRVRDFLTGERGVIGNSFDAGLAESLADGNRSTRVEPFALLHQLEE